VGDGSSSGRGALARGWRTARFAGGAVVDALVLPVSLAYPRRRVAKRVLAAAGRPPRGALAADAGHARLRRLHRRLAHRLQHLGPEDLDGVLDVEGLARVEAARATGRGVLLVGTHGGPPHALSAAMRALGLDALHVRQQLPPPWDPPVRTVVLDDSKRTAVGLAQGLLEAHAELRRGGLVAFTLEGPFGRRRAWVRVDGVPTMATLGGAALARRSGAVAIPVIADVSALGRVLVRFGAPLPLEEGDASTSADERWVRNAAAAFEALLADRAPSRRFERLYEAMRFSNASLHRPPRKVPADAVA
jgi:lauroyl/myristoyl acyltransferase